MRILLPILLLPLCFALNERRSGRSPTGLLMGDAFTSIADDESTLFYNPALLARHTGFSFVPFNPLITVTNPLNEDAEASDGDSSATQAANDYLGVPAHIGLNLSPGFKMGKFGLTAIYDNQTNIILQDQVTPRLDIDYRNDTGFIAGFAYPLFGNYSNKSGGSHLAVGGAIKYINRESINNSFKLLSPTIINAFDAGEFDEVLDALGRVRGQGWGFDMGMDYAVKSGASSFMLSLALLDISTNIITEENDNDFEVQQNEFKANLGTAWRVDIGGGLGYTLSLDVRDMQTQMEFMKRIRVGAAVKLTPALKLMAGINANRYSYGARLNIGLIDVYGGFYDLDIGEKLGQVVSRRALIYFSLFDFTFDP